MLVRTEMIDLLRTEMVETAKRLEFEKAARLRDRIKELEDMPEVERVEREDPSKMAKPRVKPGTAGSRAGITSKGTKRKRS